MAAGEGAGRSPRRLRVEADGGSRGNPGPAGYGAVVRDAETGEVLAERAESIGTASNNVAEYRGLIAGLLAAREIDPHAEVDVRLDSRLLVEQMAGRWKIKHAGLRELAVQAAAILPREQLDYGWVPRAQNKHADRLANEAMDAAERGEAWSPGATVPGGEVEVPAAIDEATPAVAGVPNRLVGWDAEAPVTTLVLLRHGETALTAAKRFSGRGEDPALSERGRWQAERAADLFAARGTIEAVVSSPLRRARETAETVAGRLGLRVQVDDDLRECDFGAWEGLTLAEVQRGWPAELAAWLADTSVQPPGGESFDELGARVAVARSRALARHAGRTVLLVTHVTPIKQLVREALGAPGGALFRMELSPASVSVVHAYGDGYSSLRLFNDTAHLREPR